MDLIKKSLSILAKNNIYIRDFYIDALFDYANTLNIVVVLGQRRIGKSFVILGLLKKLKVNLNKIFYLNKEIDENNEIFESKKLSEIYLNFIEINGEPEYIIIDEIQDIQNWENFIRARFAEKKFKIIISGSNSDLLNSELTTYITGRYLNFYVYPFSYDEYLDFLKLINNDENLRNYLIYGGLPEVLMIDNLSIKINYIKSVFDTLLLKDVIKRYKIKDIGILERILKFLANNIGSITSMTNITNYIHKEGFTRLSVNTVGLYLKCLQNAYIINSIPRFDLKGKKLLEYKDKYYFTDLGMRNILGYNLDIDIGKLIENIVYLKLKKYGYEIYVGELYDKEIDFVATKNNIQKYIQVAYLINNEKTKEREFNNLYNLKGGDEKMVISLDPIAGGTSQGIKRINLKDFLIQENI